MQQCGPSRINSERSLRTSDKNPSNAGCLSLLCQIERAKISIRQNNKNKYIETYQVDWLLIPLYLSASDKRGDLDYSLLVCLCDPWWWCGWGTGRGRRGRGIGVVWCVPTAKWVGVWLRVWHNIHLMKTQQSSNGHVISTSFSCTISEYSHYKSY